MTNEHQLTAQEVDKMCDRLKYKYPQYGKRDDLKSEAILAIYERLATHPDTHPAELYNIARLAMSDFINIKDRIVAVPVNPTTRAIANRRTPPKSSYTETGLGAIREALQPTTEYVECDKKPLAQTEDCTEDYETQDFVSKAMALLTTKESNVVNMRYFEDRTQEQVADFYGVSQKTVNGWEAKALAKMSKL